MKTRHEGPFTLNDYESETLMFVLVSANTTLDFFKNLLNAITMTQMGTVP